MMSVNVGRTRVFASTKARWGHRDGLGREQWHQRGFALGIIRYGFWGPDSARILRIPLTRRTYVE